jgi:hypothetical protein
MCTSGPKFLVAGKWRQRGSGSGAIGGLGCILLHLLSSDFDLISFTVSEHCDDLGAAGGMQMLLRAIVCQMSLCA